MQLLSNISRASYIICVWINRFTIVQTAFVSKIPFLDHEVSQTCLWFCSSHGAVNAVKHFAKRVWWQLHNGGSGHSRSNQIKDVFNKTTHFLGLSEQSASRQIYALRVWALGFRLYCISPKQTGSRRLLRNWKSKNKITFCSNRLLFCFGIDKQRFVSLNDNGESSPFGSWCIKKHSVISWLLMETIFQNCCSSTCSVQIWSMKTMLDTPLFNLSFVLRKLSSVSQRVSHWMGLLKVNIVCLRKIGNTSGVLL